jgi:pyridoxal phosphate enzyme (YggS family)
MMEEKLAVDIVHNLVRVRARMADAAHRVGRQPDEITLVAVSKTKPLAAIQEAYSAGQRDFGENRLEELWQKVEQAAMLGLPEIRWHAIGAIQSRKSTMAVGPFALIHSIDRVKIAERLSRDANATSNVLSVLLEVNVSGEGSKHGFTPDELRQTAGVLSSLPGLRIEGLMTMAPLVADPQETRPIFQALRALRDELARTQPTANWRHLSMGMTNDFEVAIEEGATIVRIGSAIFGERNHL